MALLAAVAAAAAAAATATATTNAAGRTITVSLLLSLPSHSVSQHLITDDDPTDFVYVKQP
jgi:hypothetical protein